MAQVLLSQPAEEPPPPPSQSQQQQLSSVLELLLALLRKSLVGCRPAEEGEVVALPRMEIGWPTDVRHVVHVTFDRFHGFLGLPVELETCVPRRAPSASASVFGVSTDSMQCSFDPRGNSVPTILLLMQRRLYEQGGLRAEGIFRINAENSHEELVRDRLNHGVVPDGVDVHCLAGLIKAWFRELPRGVLDSVPPEQVMQCQSEDDCAQVAKQLPPTEAALLDWAVNLMADVVQEEQANKMNARNVAMVFAPNMTQMSDPLTALMYAVQVMNFLKMLIQKALKDRQDSSLEDSSRRPQEDPSGENDSQNLPLLAGGELEGDYASEDPPVVRPADGNEEESTCVISGGESRSEDAPPACPASSCRSRVIRGGPGHRRGRKGKVFGLARAAMSSAAGAAEKAKGTSIVSRINTKTERIEAWR